MSRYVSSCKNEGTSLSIHNNSLVNEEVNVPSTEGHDQDVDVQVAGVYIEIDDEEEDEERPIGENLLRLMMSNRTVVQQINCEVANGATATVPIELLEQEAALTALSNERNGVEIALNSPDSFTVDGILQCVEIVGKVIS